MANLIKKIDVPEKYRKRTTLAAYNNYDTIEIYDNKVIGYLDNVQKMTWYYKDYNGIDFVESNGNSQFAQIVFLTGVNSKNRSIGLDFNNSVNANAMRDTNRILFCSGMFSFNRTNTFAEPISNDIRSAFTAYNENAENKTTGTVVNALSPADEIKKYKELLDAGILTQEEFDAKKKQLLGL